MDEKKYISTLISEVNSMYNDSLSIELSKKIVDYWNEGNKEAVKYLIDCFDKLEYEEIEDKYILGTLETIRIFSELVLQTIPDNKNISLLYEDYNYISILEVLMNKGSLTISELNEVLNMDNKKLIENLIKILVENKFVNQVESNQENFYNISYTGINIIRNIEPKWISKSVNILKGLFYSLNGTQKEISSIIKYISEATDEDEWIISKFVNGYINILEDNNVVKSCVNTDWIYKYYLSSSIKNKYESWVLDRKGVNSYDDDYLINNSYTYDTIEILTEFEMQDYDWIELDYSTKLICTNMDFANPLMEAVIDKKNEHFLNLND